MERNYNTYLNGMAKSECEKLFFMNHLCLDDYDVIIDFGCGGGNILKTCAENSVAKCYGVDKDPFMRSVAGRNCANTNAIVVENLKDIPIKNNEYVLVIFSSVLHEMESGWYEIEDYLHQFKNRLTIAVRDMYFDIDQIYPVECWEMAQVVRYSNPQLLADFIQRYGMKSNRQMYHYLLKYSYVDNWELELQEDYFSFKWNSLTDCATEIVYDRPYILEAKRQKVQEHFGINLTLPTHRQLIVKW